MGAKFSKSSKGEKKWEDMKVNGKSLPENFDKTSTLPASFRRRDEEVVMTGTLPRNLNRNQSFSKRFRKSCKNWAAQRGLIDPCKADNQTETQSQVPTKPSSVVLAQEECKDKITDVAQELPEVVITKAQSLDMLVESNSIPKTSSNDDSTKPEKEIVSEGEALSNSGKAEIVIEASSQDTEASDVEPTKDSAAIKTSESNSEEIITNAENKNVEIAEVKYDPKPLDETKEKEDKIDTNDVVKETEPVVTKTNESETDKEEKVSITEEVKDPCNVPSIEKSEIVETVTMHEKVPTEEVAHEVNEVIENTEKEIELDTEKENFVELKEVIDTESVPEAELQTEILTKEVEELNAESEKTTMESLETAAGIVDEQKVEKEEILSTPEIVKKDIENDTNTSTLIQEQTTAEEVATESVILEEKVVNETEEACVIEANEKESETTEEDNVQDNEIVTSEEKIPDENIIEANIENDAQTEKGEDEKIPLPEVDQEECLTVTNEDSFNAEKTSSIESELKITNEIENTTPIPADEVPEVAENIEVTDRNSDNLVDKEEASHDNGITDDNKSQEVMEEGKNNLNISEDNCNEGDNHLEESCVEQEELGTADISTENIQGDGNEENSEDPLPSNTTSDSPSETEVVSLEKTECKEQVSEEIKEEEGVAIPNEAINSSDGIWKCQWDLPCLATKVDEEAVMTMQAPEMTNEELTEKSENQQSELANEEELSTMNEALDSSNTDIEPTDVKIESVTENESKEEIQADLVAPCEPENEKKTEAVNDELDSTTKFEAESNISLPELEEVEMKTENLDMENAEPNSLESLDDEKCSSEKAINNENKHVETAMKDILTDIVDNIASKSEMTSLENVTDASADDLISEGGSEGCVSTDEGIAASDDDDKDSCKSDELKKDNAKENATSEIENLITEIDQHP